MNRLFDRIKFTIGFLFLFIGVLLLMIICLITYIPHLIYTMCAGALAGGANVVTNVEKDAEMRDRDR